MYSGHNHIVNDVSWSKDSSYIVTASDDKTAVLWQKGTAEPVMLLNTTKGNIADKEGQVKDKVHFLWFILTLENDSVLMVTAF